MPTLDEQIVLAISADITNLRRAVVQMGGVIQQMASQQEGLFNKVGNAAETASGKVVAASRRQRQAVVADSNAAADAAISANSRASSYAINNARNLSFQINDVVSALATGQGIRGVSQQFGQIAQSFSGTGIVETLGALLTKSNLITIGLTAAGAAATYFFSQSKDGSKQADEALKHHSDAINALKDAYGDAAKNIEEFTKVTKDMALAISKMDKGVLEAEQKIASADFFTNFKDQVEKLATDFPTLDLSDLFTIDTAAVAKRVDQLRAYLTAQAARKEAGQPFDEAGMNAAITLIDNLETASGQLAAGYGKLTGSASIFQRALDELSISAADGTADFVGFQKAILAIIASQEHLTPEQAKVAQALLDSAKRGIELQRAYEAIIKASRTVQLSLAEIQKVLLAMGAAWATGFGPGVIAAIEQVIAKLGGVNEVIRQISNAISGIGTDIGNAWTAAGAEIKSTTDLIKQRESFRSKAYWDVNHYRVGYGSDTYMVGGEVREVTKDTIVSIDQADADLSRRIDEFQRSIQKKIGPDMWASLTDKQQAALTDITYNYGHLPDVVAAAIKTGDKGQVARAIQGLGGDNAGINRSRREQEAALYAEGDAFSDSALKVGQMTEAQKAENDQTRERLKLSGDLTKAFDQETYDRVYAAEVSEKMAKAEEDARARGAPLTQKEIDQVKELAAEKAKLAAQEEGSKKAKENEKDIERRIQSMQDENAELEKKAELMGTTLTALEASLTAEERDQAIRDGKIAALQIENDYKEKGIALTQAQTQAIEEQQQQLALGKAAFKEFDDTTKESKKSMEQFNEQMGSIFKSAISGFISDLRHGKSAAEAFSNMLDKVIDGLINMALEMLFSKNALGGLFGGGLGGGGGGIPFSFAEQGGKVGRPGAKRRGDPRWFIGAPSFAAGGPVLPHGVVPILAHAGETVLPKGASLGGDVTNNVGDINIDMSATGLTTATSEQGKMLGRQIQAAVQVVLIQESRPGGILRKQPGAR